MKKIVLKVKGMTCSACSTGLEKYLNKQKGIVSANVNLVLSIATIEYENIKPKEIEEYIKKAGFKSLGEFTGIEEQKNQTEKIKLIILGILIILMMYSMLSHIFNLPIIPYLNFHNPSMAYTTMFCTTMLFLWYGYDIIKSGIKNLLHKMPNMDTLVMFSVVASLFYSLYAYQNILKGNLEYTHNIYFESICMVIYFIKLGRWIENKSKDKTKEAIKDLVQITPKYAILKTKEGEKKISLDEVNINDILICKTGEKIAVDGIVTNGKTYVEESFLTGESYPVLKEKGSKVIAGSISYEGYIEYQAQKIGKQSTISEIVQLVIESTNTKNKIQKLADKISSYFVPTILLIALLTFIVEWFCNQPIEQVLNHFLTILVVACPCALGLAVPLVVVVSSGLCAKKGLFLRNSDILEKAKNIDTIVLDKTGTITLGKLNIFKIYNYSSYSNQELVNIVSNIEKNSSHPISTAFTIKEKIEVTDFKTINGMGIYAKVNQKEYTLGNEKMIEQLKIENQYKQDSQTLQNQGCSIIYIVENHTIISLIGVKDTIREEIKETIQTFQKNKIEVMMLTGDNEATAKIIADEIGIKQVIANVLPKNKAEHIQKQIDSGKKVIMVGDGINDAPALVTATIGISVKNGTDIAMDAADVILMNNNMNNILDLIKISTQAYHIIQQNLFWAFFYNLCMIPIAMGLLENFGIHMTPMIGSIAMTFSSLTVVLNSIRFSKKNYYKSK